MKTNETLTYAILSKDERKHLTLVDEKLSKFENIFKTFITSQHFMKYNCILIKGSHGIGKTYNSTKWLNDLIEDGKILNYEYLSGSITPLGLFEALKVNSKPGQVSLLDDCEIFNNDNKINMMKAATDSKSEEKPRIVTYTSQAGIQSYKYEGVVIMITNEDYHKSSNPHIKAQLSRTHTFEMNLNLYDMYIKNLSIVENFINKKRN
jgi:hypothetical protein